LLNSDILKNYTKLVTKLKGESSKVEVLHDANSHRRMGSAHKDLGIAKLQVDDCPIPAAPQSTTHRELKEGERLLFNPKRYAQKVDIVPNDSSYLQRNQSM